MKIPEIEATQCGGISAKPRTEGRAQVASGCGAPPGHGARPRRPGRLEPELHLGSLGQSCLQALNFITLITNADEYTHHE